MNEIAIRIQCDFCDNKAVKDVSEIGSWHRISTLTSRDSFSLAGIQICPGCYEKKMIPFLNKHLKELTTTTPYAE